MGNAYSGPKRRRVVEVNVLSGLCTIPTWDSTCTCSLSRFSILYDIGIPKSLTLCVYEIRKTPICFNGHARAPYSRPYLAYLPSLPTRYWLETHTTIATTMLCDLRWDAHHAGIMLGRDSRLVAADT